MTALATDRVTLKKDVGLKAYPIAATTIIYAGSMVAINTSGYAVPAADTAAFLVVGIADARYDNSAGAAGDLWCKVYSPCLALLGATSITQAMVGRLMYVVDDQTFDDTRGTNGVPAGILREYVSTTSGYLEIGGGVNLPTAGGYKIKAGQHTTVAAADTVVTGLALVVGVIAQLDSDPVDGAMHVTSSIGDQAGAPAAGSILVNTWKSTDGDATLIAATTFSLKVNWWAFGI